MRLFGLFLSFVLFITPSFAQTPVPLGPIGGVSGGGGGSGTVTSVGGGCASVAAPNPVIGAGNISTQRTPNDVTGSNSPITTGYCGEEVDLDNASAQTPTIAEAGQTGFPANWYTTICNINSGVQTLTPASPGTIGGAATLIFPAGSPAHPNCAGLTSDGVSNYTVEFLSPTFANVRVVVRTATSTSDTIALSDYFVCADNSGGAATETLPTAVTGMTFLIKDCGGNAATHNITVTPAGGNIDGAGTFVMNTAYQSVAVTYTGSQWSTN